MQGINHFKNEEQISCQSFCGTWDAVADAVIAS